MERRNHLRSALFLSQLWALSGFICFSCLSFVLIISPPTAAAQPGQAAGMQPPIVQPTAFIPLSVTSTAEAPAAEISPAQTEPSSIEPAETASAHGTGILQVIFIDVGQGLSVLIIDPSGEAALFDGGPADAGPKVIATLTKHKIEAINIMFSSHPHVDHIGGLIDVLHQVPVRKVVTNGQAHTTATYEEFLDAILAKDAEYIETGMGGSFPMGSVVFQVYNPPAPQPEGDLNHNSLVVHFQFGNHAFLLMGDADQEAEFSILSLGMDVKADVLQAGHHCSSDSTSPVFVQAVKPMYAVCSVGAGNAYGHPHPQTLQTLVDAGVNVFRTDLSGSVVFSSDGINLSVQEEK
jgi:competence protein ComEC